jgi:hypothetical protein
MCACVPFSRLRAALYVRVSAALVLIRLFEVVADALSRQLQHVILYVVCL